MVKETCSVVFRGEIKPGFEKGLVQKSLVALLQIEEQATKNIFSGNLLELKTEIDKSTAEKYQKALLQIGAIAYVSDGEDRYKAEEARNGLESDLEDELNSHRDIPLQFLNRIDVPKALDTELSDPGVTLVELRPEPLVKFDTSNFSLAESGENIVPPTASIERDFDLQHLSLETTNEET